MTARSSYGEVRAEPFIKPAYRRDILEDLANAPLIALETRLRALLGQHPDTGEAGVKKDGKDGAAESPLTSTLDELRIKDDKLQTEKFKESTDKKDSSDSKEACDVRESTSIFGTPEALAFDDIRAVEELQASRLGVTLRRGAPII